MSNAEPVDFLRERRSRQPGSPEPRPAPVQQERSLAPRPEQTAQRERKPEKKGPRCSCCGLPGERVHVFLDMGRGVLLCDGCIQVCNDILRDEDISTDAVPEPSASPSFPSRSSRTRYYCSFCGKEQEHVARLVAMLNNLFICNVCVGRCNAGLVQALGSVIAEKTGAFDQEQALKEYTRLMEAGPVADNEQALQSLLEQAYAQGLYFDYNREIQGYRLTPSREKV